MSKKTKNNYRLTSDKQPTAVNVDFPVFVPNEDGSTDIEIGRARLRYGTLVVEFKNSAPSVAIQNMIERGVLMGFGMIMIKPDVVNEMYQEVVASEEAEAKRVAEGIADGTITVDENGAIVEDTYLERLADEQHITDDDVER